MTLETRLAQLHTASTETVTVAVTNESAANGISLTPVFTALHDGSFDLFNVDEAASMGLERIAEDGATGTLLAEFAAATGGAGTASVSTGGPVAPGVTVTTSLAVENSATQRFFTYASMIIPSNDAFIGNGNPTMFAVFTSTGRYTGAVDFTVTGARVWDAGTEINNEQQAAFLNQTGPNMGDTEGGVVHVHPGFNGSAGNPEGGPVNILSGTAVNAAGGAIDPIAADFTLNGGANPVASFSISLVEHGAAGQQMLVGGSDADVFFGGAGADHLVGMMGEDHLFGETGSDRLYGGEGNDLLIGGQGKDFADGGAGDDGLSGGAGDDELHGGEGDDILGGGAGKDSLTGGTGADLFVYTSGRDTITDFDAGEGDLILLAGEFDLESVLANVRQSNKGAVLNLGDAGQLILTGINAADVTADMFLHLGGGDAETLLM